MITCLNCSDERPAIYDGEWDCCGCPQVVEIPLEYEEDPALWRYLRRFGFTDAIASHYPGIQWADPNDEISRLEEEALIEWE